MAYIPPHKRHSRGNTSPTELNPFPVPVPTPESLPQHFKRTLSSKPLLEKKINRDRNRGDRKIMFAPGAVSKWFPVGLASVDSSDNDDIQFLSMTRLEPFYFHSFERNFGEQSFALVLNHDRIKESGEDGRVFLENPWMFVAENISQDLLAALQRATYEMKDNDFELVKPTLVARFGRVLFHGVQTNLPGHSLREMKRSFNTNVSSSFLESIINEIVPKLNTAYEGERELYHIKLSDSMKPDSTFSCKCTLAKDEKKLKLYKMEWNQVRHLVVDMSCLDKFLDLRLTLASKRIIKGLTDDEIKCIALLTDSAILDPGVKGGLRWPLGTDSAGDRYTVVGVWHTTVKSFRNSSIRLKVRNADRFDCRTSSGEVSKEVILRMYDTVSHLQERPMQDDHFIEMMRSNLKLIWDYFLCFASAT